MVINDIREGNTISEKDLEKQDEEWMDLEWTGFSELLMPVQQNKDLYILHGKTGKSQKEPNWIDTIALNAGRQSLRPAGGLDGLVLL